MTVSVVVAIICIAIAVAFTFGLCIRRIRLLEKYVTQLELDVQMLIQNSTVIDK